MNSEFENVRQKFLIDDPFSNPYDTDFPKCNFSINERNQKINIP